MIVHLVIRGFAGSALVFLDRLEVEFNQREQLFETVVAKHMDMVLPYARWMIEIELLDEPDRDYRYFRFGTTAGRMGIPYPVDFEDHQAIKDALKKWGKQ